VSDSYESIAEDAIALLWEWDQKWWKESRVGLPVMHADLLDLKRRFAAMREERKIGSLTSRKGRGE
jgi:hypothetical protein